jgi:hypothetical protein
MSSSVNGSVSGLGLADPLLPGRPGTFLASADDQDLAAYRRANDELRRENFELKTSLSRRVAWYTILLLTALAVVGVIVELLTHHVTLYGVAASIMYPVLIIVVAAAILAALWTLYQKNKESPQCKKFGSAEVARWLHTLAEGKLKYGRDSIAACVRNIEEHHIGGTQMCTWASQFAVQELRGIIDFPGPRAADCRIFVLEEWRKMMKENTVPAGVFEALAH